MSRRKDFGTGPAVLAPEVERLLSGSPPRPPIWQASPAEARAVQDRVAAARTRGPEVGAVRDTTIAGPGGPLNLRIYAPATTPAAVIVYCHGGGWVIGSIADSDAHVRRMVVATGCIIISVGYRLAPEHPFPAQLEDVLAAWRWATMADLAPGTPVGIAGDSAGGNLAAGATIALRDAGEAVPAFQILGYPVLGAAMDTASYHDQVDGPVLSAADMRWFWDQYAPSPATRIDPRASPLDTPSVAGLPPALIMTAGCDPLRDEGGAYAARLAAAGVAVEYRCFPGMCHGFYKMADILTGGRKALATAGAFIRQQCPIGGTTMRS